MATKSEPRWKRAAEKMTDWDYCRLERCLQSLGVSGTLYALSAACRNRGVKGDAEDANLIDKLLGSEELHS